MRKNSSLVFNYVATKIEILPREILFIDNKEKLITYAKEAGYQTYLFKDAQSLKNYLTEQKLIK